MSISLVQEITSTSAGGTNQISATLGSAPTSGNLLVWASAHDKTTGGNLTGLTNFSPVIQIDGTSVSIHMWWKVSDGSETTMTATRGNNSAAGDTVWYAEYQDTAVSGSNWQVTDSAFSTYDDTAVQSRSTNTTGTLSADGLAVAQHGIDSSSNLQGNFAWTNSYTQRFALPSDGGGGSGRGGIIIATKAVSSGATTETTFSKDAGSADQLAGGVAVFTKVSGASPQQIRPDADITTTGWTTTPLFSKINDESDATVITGTLS